MLYLSLLRACFMLVFTFLRAKVLIKKQQQVLNRVCYNFSSGVAFHGKKFVVYSGPVKGTRVRPRLQIVRRGEIPVRNLRCLVIMRTQMRNDIRLIKGRREVQVADDLDRYAARLEPWAFLAVFRARAGGRRAAHSPVSDPARLRARIVLSEQAR